MIFENNRSFVVSITLTELALLLFFILLFAATNEISDLQAERDEALEEQKQVSTMLAMLSDSMDTSPEFLADLLQKSAELQNALDSSRKEVVELRARMAELDAIEAGLEELRAQLAEAGAENDEEVYHLIRQAAQKIGEERELTALRESVVNLESELADCSSQNLNCSRRLNEAGMGYPPCWADAGGRPEYIYEVVLRESTIEVKATWPSGRDDDVQSVDGAAGLANRSLTRSEFTRLAQPLLDWSKRQEPECRHFVTITDTRDMSKAAFKSNLLLVENYFYKYLNPDSP